MQNWKKKQKGLVEREGVIMLGDIEYHSRAMK